MKLWMIVFLLLSAFFSLGIGQTDASKDQKKEKLFITADDVINMEGIYDLQVSPNSQHVVWVQSKSSKEKDLVLTQLWMASLVTKMGPVQLTKGDNSCRSPRWSPDGKKLAFLSDRVEKSQIFIINPFGGEAEKLTDVKMGVNAFAWKDIDTIIFTAREDEYQFEKVRKEKKDDAEVFEDIETFFSVRLFSFSVKDKKIIRLSENKDQIQDFEISPDGKWAVSTHIDTPRFMVEAKHRPKYFLTDLVSGKPKQIFTEKYFSPSQYQWSEDSKELYLTEEKTNFEKERGNGITLLYCYDPINDQTRGIPLNWTNGVGGIYGKSFDTAENIIVTSLAKGVINPFVMVEKKYPFQWVLTKVDHPQAANFNTFALTRDAKGIVFVSSTAQELPKLYYARMESGTLKDVRSLAEFNQHLKDKFIAAREIVRWKSRNNREIEGILYYPKDFQKGQKYPLILNIHGGPFGYDPDAFELSWAYYPHILSAKNCFVLFVNYSGSSNYGLDFAESIYGRYYELEIPDILSGVDTLIRRGLVDAEKIGTQGWSNGSILSIALTVEVPQRIKVALCGAGDVNWVSDYGNCAFGPQFDDLYFGGSYFKSLDNYLKKSPLFRMNRVVTPTIIFFGDKDTNVPFEQGFQHYRALQILGKALVKFVIFPGEPHGLRRLSHQKRKVEEELAWLDAHFFKKEAKEIKAFKQGAPLDIALKKSFKKDESGMYGVKEMGILIPEMVKIEGLAVARFEVTRAQFAGFLNENKDIETRNLVGWKQETFEPGTGNFPVSGIDYQTALKYCLWLSKKSGKKFRLPTEKEMENWLKKVSGEENTLCYWAGYDLSLEEAVELEGKIAELESKTKLILAVGTFSASIEDVYDLNGNVSEWGTVEGNNEGKPLGLNARSRCDKRQSYKPALPGYIGFRIVTDEVKSN